MGLKKKLHVLTFSNQMKKIGGEFLFQFQKANMLINVTILKKNHSNYSTCAFKKITVYFALKVILLINIRV
jgi:hypothetical protein